MSDKLATAPLPIAVEPVAETTGVVVGEPEYSEYHFNDALPPLIPVK